MQHSELRDVNPGDAVRMDSGETIAQWRKQYFQKFGVRYALSVDVFLPYKYFITKSMVQTWYKRAHKLMLDQLFHYHLCQHFACF